MGRKSMDLAESVLANVVSTLGPSRFAKALHNVTRNGVLYDCKNVDMDGHDEDAQEIWLDQIDRLRQVGLWLEEQQDIPDFAKTAAEKISRSDQRSLAELKVDDHSIQQIVVIESLVFEATGFKIQILRKSSSKKTLVLRGSLLWFAGAMINLAEEDNDLLDVLAFVARCIPEQGVKVCYDEHEYACAPDYDRVKYRKLHEQEKEDSDVSVSGVSIKVLELEDLICRATGCPVRVGRVSNEETFPAEDDDLIHIKGITRSFLARSLENMVVKRRTVGFMTEYVSDLIGDAVESLCNSRFILMGDEMPISAKRAAGRSASLT